MHGIQEASEPSVLQQYSVEGKEDLLKLVGGYVRETMGRNVVPGHPRVYPPENFTSDELVLESLIGRLGEIRSCPCYRDAVLVKDVKGLGEELRRLW